VQQDTNLSKEQRDAMAAKRATGTPLWKGFSTLVKYRTTRNYKCAARSGSVRPMCSCLQPQS
jgi:hypothetical protein